MDKVLLVSADGHAGAPLWVYRDYLEGQYREAFDEWRERQREVVQALRTTSTFGAVEMPGRRRPFLAEDPREGITVEEVMDPDTRVKNLEAEGVVAEVLYPGPDFAKQMGFPFANVSGTLGTSLSNGLFGSDATARDMELAEAGERAYNRWLAEFCSQLPGRALGLMHPPRSDMDAAVKALKWGRGAGLRGIQMPSDDPRVPPYWDEYWEPFWSTCEDLSLPIHFHGGSSHNPDKGLPDGNEAVRAQVLAVEAPFWFGRPLKILIYGGVLERHPKLKIVFTEFTCDWIPNLLARMEWFHREPSLRNRAAVELPRPPSEYWYRQCYVGASLLSRDEVAARDQIGAGNMMYGVDYPHPEGSWGRTKPWLQQIFGSTGISEADLRKILGGTAVEVYGLDVEQLAPIVERVGLTVSELTDATPRRQSEWGESFEYMSSPYRKAAWTPHETMGA
jgi:predicted TIM-barrel fold metal-dependent hydrolase